MTLHDLAATAAQAARPVTIAHHQFPMTIVIAVVCCFVVVVVFVILIRTTSMCFWHVFVTVLAVVALCLCVPALAGFIGSAPHATQQFTHADK